MVDENYQFKRGMRKIDRRTKEYRQGFKDGERNAEHTMFMFNIGDFHFAHGSKVPKGTAQLLAKNYINSKKGRKP